MTARPGSNEGHNTGGHSLPTLDARLLYAIVEILCPDFFMLIEHYKASLEVIAKPSLKGQIRSGLNPNKTFL